MGRGRWGRGSEGIGWGGEGDWGGVWGRWLGLRGDGNRGREGVAFGEGWAGGKW